MDTAIPILPSVCPRDRTSTCAPEVERLDACTIGRVCDAQRLASANGGWPPTCKTVSKAAASRCTAAPPDPLPVPGVAQPHCRNRVCAT
jgi:hypothetical protein